MKQASIDVLNFVKQHDGEQMTAQDIADSLGVSVKSVNAIVTASFQRHKDADKNIVPLMQRVPAEIELSDGTHKAVKFIELTDEGRTFEPVLTK